MYCLKCGTLNDGNAFKCVKCNTVLRRTTGSVGELPAKVPNYLAQSIIVTLFCCLPLGIPAIVFSSKVNGKLQTGDIKGAMKASRTAKTLCWWSLGLGILLIVLPITMPAVNQALHNTALTQTVSNGANIHKAVFASQMDDVVLGGGYTSWPKKGDFQTSTAYFKSLVASGVLNVSYDFFSARGLPPAKSTNANDFTAENNAWRVVLGLDDAPGGTPFMFTRNYNPGTLRSGDEPIVLDDVPPFGKEGMVVVLKDGSAYFLRGNQLRNSYFNPAQTPSGANITIIGP